MVTNREICKYEGITCSGKKTAVTLTYELRDSGNVYLVEDVYFADDRGEEAGGLLSTSCVLIPQEYRDKISKLLRSL